MNVRRAHLMAAVCLFLAPGFANGELTVDFTVDVTLGGDGIYTYAYSLSNDARSSQSINSILLSTGQNAPILGITGPNDNWSSAYAVEEEVFQAGFATGLSEDGADCGVTDEFDLFQGSGITFSMRSPWAPADQRYAIGRTSGLGVACDFVGDFATGTIASPAIKIAECDFNRDGDCGLNDINVLATAIATNDISGKFDLNLDNQVSHLDLNLFLILAGRLNGDADFNGQVEFGDFLLLSGKFGQEALWAEGDFDADGTVAFSDFLILSGNFGKSSEPLNALAVPEPSGDWAGLVGTIMTALTYRQYFTKNQQALSRANS